MNWPESIEKLHKLMTELDRAAAPRDLHQMILIAIEIKHGAARLEAEITQDEQF